MKIKKEFKIRDIAGERVIIIPGKYGEDMTKVISLNATAEWLWNELTDKDFTIRDVATLLTGRFEIDDESALNDAEKWVKQLIECQVLE